MDFFESLFKKAADLWGQRRDERARERSAGFEEHFPTLCLLARAACVGRPLELRAVDEPPFLRGEVLALPSRVSRFSSYAHNRFALFHLALAGGARRALQGRGAAGEADCLEHLGAEFPRFAAWRAEGMAALRAELAPPELEVWLWPAERPGGPPLLRAASGSGARKRGREAPRTEREARRPGEVEVVDLEKERRDQNPVMHSFEKLETADEYRGGHRVTDASDQLDDHAGALEELSLRKVTRGGDAARSVYRADVSEIFASGETELAEEKAERFLWYPEWDYRKQALKPRHCRLYTGAGGEEGDGGAWRARLEEAYSSELLRWEQRWLGIVNERVWRNRQWEGERLDVDAYVRYLADLRSAGRGDARVFARRLRGARDLATLVLLDQSLSTDSFVDGRRVLDVELESIGLAGMLLSRLGDPVCVAGTWSETRSHCYFRTYKDYAAPWDDFFRRAPGIEPQGYTRLGPAIRHATGSLAATGARAKLLILLTDGKPTDYDRYEGRYGVEDIFHSILEAKQQGVEVRALAIEKDAKRYFPELFGPRNYKIIPSARLLPESLFHLYLEASRR